LGHETVTGASGGDVTGAVMLEPLRDADRVQRRLQSPDQLSSTGWRAVGAGTLICWFRWFLHSGLYAGVTFPDLDVVPPTGIQNGPNAERELGSQQSGLSRDPYKGHVHAFKIELKPLSTHWRKGDHRPFRISSTFSSEIAYSDNLARAEGLAEVFR